MQGMWAYIWMRGTFDREESICGTDVYEQCGSKEDRILLGVSHLLVLKWIKAAYRNMNESLEREGRMARNIIDEIELDEIYTVRKKI
jgi:hypothetical protein